MVKSKIRSDIFSKSFIQQYCRYCRKPTDKFYRGMCKECYEKNEEDIDRIIKGWTK